MATAVRNKLVVKDLGDGSQVKGMEAKNAKFVLGTIVGIATGVRNRQDKTDPTKSHTALVGDFMGIPSDDKMDRVRSSVCYLPEGIFGLIAGKLQGENAVDNVQFALEIATIKATNAAGYTWSITPKVETQEADPLAHLLEQANVKPLAVTDQSKAGTATAANAPKEKAKA